MVKEEARIMPSPEIKLKVRGHDRPFNVKVVCCIGMRLGSGTGPNRV
jgi:hypothetical protein